MKECSKCGIKKPLSEFYFAKSGNSENYLPECKECNLKKQKHYAKKRRDEIREGCVNINFCF